MNSFHRSLLKKGLEKGIATCIAASMVLPAHIAIAASAPPASAPTAKEAPQTILFKVLDRITRRYEPIMAKMPQKLLNDVQTSRSQELQTQVNAKIAGLQSGALKPEQVRAELISANKDSLRGQKDELFYQIHNLPSETLDQLSENLKENPKYADVQAEYTSAYTHTEKANAIVHAVHIDLDQVNSMLLKRSTHLTAEGLANDLRKMQQMHDTKDTDWKKLLTYAAIGIAAVGVLSWGYGEVVYGGKYRDHQNALDKEYDKLKSDLESQFNQYKQRLNEDEQQYLKDNGFVYTTCGQFEQPDSILCNRYNYQLFQGTKYCTVNCYKSTITGQQTMHSAPTCTSPFIPADCYDPSEYDHGYNDGYDHGYENGHHDGDHDGWNDGSNHGWDDGYYDGDKDGYNQGYSDGYKDGVAAASSSALIKTSAVQALGAIQAKATQRYNQGYQDGLRDALILESPSTAN